MAAPKYLVGIDLGTTNTVVAYCEQQADLNSSPVSLFDIDQLIGPGEVARRPLLPSFRYHPAAAQVAQSDLVLLWEHQAVSGDIDQVIIGEWARELGAKVEGRQVSSAKSWLSHSGVDRQSDILPWAGAQDVEKVSPVIASASYLNHIRQAWDHRHPQHPLAKQEVVITVPASFDEAARNFTLQAAKLAGLNNILLLEEPQAVCYDWYARYQATAAQQLEQVPLILVCDVGGGTTDLSLIAASSHQDSLALDRIGIGEHLMLGGDNIDLALAHLAEQRLENSGRLNAANLSKLIQQTRRAKEQLLADNAPDEVKITLLGSGSKLLGGTKSAPLTKADVNTIALNGFFPLSEFSETPDKRRRAVVEFGLPYAADAAVSKHIAEFLHQHQGVSQQALSADDDGVWTQTTPALPVGLLLNGGVFNSALITERLVNLLSHWRGTPITLLDNPHPDLAVAFGAVSYAKARHGAQLKIGGGAARSYFLQLPEKKGLGQALCLLAKGTEEGDEIRLTGRRFSLTLGEPVRFHLLTSTFDSLKTSSSSEQRIQNGQLYPIEADTFQPLPPYVAKLDGQGAALHANQKERVEVQIACQLTEVGTLKLECVAIDDESQRWQMEFELRQASHNTEDSALPKQLAASLSLITHAYSGNKKASDNREIKTLTKTLEKQLGKRDKWDFATLRQLFDTLQLGAKRRRRSEAHEKQWLRLAGYALRPGFGAPTDSWRIEHVWRLYAQGIQFKNQQGWTDWWVFWRRVSGGLNQEQQETILGDIAKYVHPGAMKNPQSAKAAHEMGYEAIVRLAAALENLHFDDKVLLGSWFLSKALNLTQFEQAHWWALGRVAARVPLYGSQHNVVPREQVTQWLHKMLDVDWQKEPMAGFAAVMMSRKTGDRTLDIDDDMRSNILEKLRSSRLPESWLTLVESVQALSETESKRAFGDALPHGLTLLT